MEAGSGQWIPIAPVDGIAGFAMSIVNAAKDWQDQLQSSLPGYRERIVHVYLDESEGGLNLAMSPPLIEKLVAYGERAGRLLVGKDVFENDRDRFDFDDHRWRRFLVAFARIEETLAKTGQVWRGNRFREFVDEISSAPPSYDGSTPAWRREVFERFDRLMDCVDGWDETLLGSSSDGRVPRPPTDIRVTPKP